MFHALIQKNPSHLTMPGSTAHFGHSWYISTVLLTAMGGFMWPHNFGSVFTAKSGDTLRRNAVIMPLYNLTLAAAVFCGIYRHSRDAGPEERRHGIAVDGAADFPGVVI